MPEIVIVSAARTPMGGFQGDLSALTAPQLGAAAIRAAVERAGIAPADVQEVIMGCVLAAGLKQSPARASRSARGSPSTSTCASSRP
jgi:acetyl-CoA C-acetyltransferase